MHSLTGRRRPLRALASRNDDRRVPTIQAFSQCPYRIVTRVKVYDDHAPCTSCARDLD
jgi:hypothetical protein